MFAEPDLADALAPVGQARMLPAAAYTSPEVLAWEQRHFFAGGWTAVGRVADLLGPGESARAVNAAGIPVLLLRDGEGTVRGCANTCRHRGHELLPEGGTSSRRALVCPYHAWSYRLDGTLLAAPGFDPRPTGHDLVPVPARVWHGWVMVNATGSAEPLESYVGALAGLLAPYQPEQLNRLASHSYDVAANWKTIVENYHECYHCPLIHPELCRVSPPDSGDNYFDLPGAWVGGRMDLRPGAATMSLDGRGGGPLIPGADPQRVVYVGLFPNLLISLHPDYVLTHRLVPLEPGLTRIECSWLFPDPATDPAYAVDFWDLTNRQDWAACESVQRSVSSPHFRPGPLADNEGAVHDFITMVARGYLGRELSAVPAGGG